MRTTDLNTHAMRQCTHCGTATVHDRTCHKCGPVARPQAFARCPGWGCPLTASCQRYLAPGLCPSNTPWLEPGYDDLFASCDALVQGEPRPAAIHRAYTIGA